VEIPSHRPSLSDFGSLVDVLLHKSAYGHVAQEIFALSCAFEVMVDRILLKALIRSDPLVAELAADKLFGPLGRERKFALLRPVLTLVGAEDADDLCAQVKKIYELRDQIAHSVVTEALDNGASARVAMTRRGQTVVSDLDYAKVMEVVEAGYRTIERLASFAGIE
jgi:hypothetical protein